MTRLCFGVFIVNKTMANPIELQALTEDLIKTTGKKSWHSVPLPFAYHPVLLALDPHFLAVMQPLCTGVAPSSSLLRLIISLS